MTDISSYNSQLTPVYLLLKEKGSKTVLSFVFNMVFPTSPLTRPVTLGPASVIRRWRGHGGLDKFSRRRKLGVSSAGRTEQERGITGGQTDRTAQGTFLYIALLYCNAELLLGTPIGVWKINFDILQVQLPVHFALFTVECRL